MQCEMYSTVSGPVQINKQTNTPLEEQDLAFTCQIIMKTVM